MNYLQPQRLDRLAREYVLGTLAGGARRRFEQLLRQTPAAMLAVTAWQERFSVLAAGVPPMQPREAVWEGLQRRLFPNASPAKPAGSLQWLWSLLSGRALAGALAGVLLCVVVLRLQPGLVGLEAQTEALPANAAPFPVATLPALPSKGSVTVTLPDTSEKLFFSVPRLMVTFEPAPAHPGDRPAGEPVWSGHCVKLW